MAGMPSRENRGAMAGLPSRESCYSGLLTTCKTKGNPTRESSSVERAHRLTGFLPGLQHVSYNKKLEQKATEGTKEKINKTEEASRHQAGITGPAFSELRFLCSLMFEIPSETDHAPIIWNDARRLALLAGGLFVVEQERSSLFDEVKD